jgi:hypothetical protein
VKSGPMQNMKLNCKRPNGTGEEIREMIANRQALTRLARMFGVKRRWFESNRSLRRRVRDAITMPNLSGWSNG